MQLAGNILFKETQHFRLTWIWWLVVLCMASSIGVTILVSRVESQDTKMPWLVLGLIVPLELVLLYLFYITRLETTVTSEGIFFKWWPFQRSYSWIPVRDVKQSYSRKGPFNYGYHWTFSHGRSHSMGPGKGLQFVLNNGKKIFLGTQRLTAFHEAVEQMIRQQRK
jgi:hypothetical protein